MFNKISIQKAENLPMPLIFLASAEDLARWQADQLQWAFAKGHRDLAISCFDTASMGFDVREAAPIVLHAVMNFLAVHSEVHHLTIFCGDEASYRAYSCQLDIACVAHEA